MPRPPRRRNPRRGPRARELAGMRSIVHVERGPQRQPADADAARAARRGDPPAPAEAPAPRTARRSRAQLILYPPARHPHAFEVAIVDYSATGIGIIHTEG